MYEVLYRKYRPQSLSEVIGQEHVVTILSNAIKKGEVGHAYLFAGSRGTGKTSVARILASNIGISGIDLIEIDAASHRGIEKIREIKEAIEFAPTSGGKKMYILDEVHMLTNEAFNALLKTLEEPPSHSYFVLCTTEAHKIPPTVLSRCQRLDFIAPSEDILTQFIEKVSRQEGVEIDPEAAAMIASLARNSYRDGLTLLDKLIGYTSGNKLVPIAINKALGLGDDRVTDILFSYIEQKDVLGFLNKLQNSNDNDAHIARYVDMMVERLAKLVVRSYSMVGNTIGGANFYVAFLDALITARIRMAKSTNPMAVVMVELLKTFPKNNSNEIVSEQALDSKLTEEIDLLDPVVPQLEETKDTKQSQANEELNTEWEKILVQTKLAKRQIEALLKAARPVRVTQDEFELTFSYAFHKQKMEELENRQVLEKILQDYFERPLRVIFSLDKDPKNDQAIWDSPANLPVIPPEVKNVVPSERPQKVRLKRETGNDNQVGKAESSFSRAHTMLGGQLIE